MSDAAADDPSIAGGWLGTYYRNSYQPPVRFEATFILREPEGAFGGTILDDGPLGEAVVLRAVQSGRHVRFTKSYRHRPPERATGPIRYLGTLSEDGLRVFGTWELTIRRGGAGDGARVVGRWDARRLWGEGAASEATLFPEPAAVPALSP